MNTYTKFWLSIILALAFFRLNAQQLELGVERGFSTYFGDLAPYSVTGSFEGGNAATGFFVGWHTGDIFSIRLNYMQTVLEGADSGSSNEGRKLRNFSFRSPIMEYGITGSINIMPIIDRNGVMDRWRLLITSGFNIFSFNPQTKYNGEYVDLQPLGTEGQGTSFRPGVEKYNLTQVNIPLGFGISYEIARDIHLGFGTTFRKTFTDYLDDVSTSYAPLDILAQENGELAAELSYRADEITGSVEGFNPTGSRGNAREDDWYMSSYLSISFTLGKTTLNRVNPFAKKVRCPHKY